MAPASSTPTAMVASRASGASGAPGVAKNDRRSPSPAASSADSRTRCVVSLVSPVIVSGVAETVITVDPAAGSESSSSSATKIMTFCPGEMDARKSANAWDASVQRAWFEVWVEGSVVMA